MQYKCLTNAEMGMDGMCCGGFLLTYDAVNSIIMANDYMGRISLSICQYQWQINIHAAIRLGLVVHYCMSSRYT